MAGDAEKSFAPSARKLSKAREGGNVARSTDLGTALTLLAGLTLLMVGTPVVFSALQTLARQVFLQAATTRLSPDAVQHLLAEVGWAVIGMLAPFLGTLLVLGIAHNLLQTGFNVTTQVLQPKLRKISPLKGFQRMFSSRALVVLGLGLLKVGFLATIAWAYLQGRLPEMLRLHTLPTLQVVELLGAWLRGLLVPILLMLFFLAGLDYLYQRWKYMQDLRMTKQEVQDETKESEGNPQVKRRQRKMAQEIARRPRLDQAVQQADVVITNPTHYAVVLRYDPTEAPAPRVLAKGIRKRALRIKAMALEMGIPAIENRPLARALYDQVPELGEIPADLYPAVAALLAEIYRRKGRRAWAAGRTQPAP
jgi:flagellar biosynthetic protein FlhB